MRNDRSLLSEDCFRWIAQNAPVGLALIDGGGKIVFWNDAAKGIFGYEQQEVNQRNWHFLVDAHDDGQGRDVLPKDLRSYQANAPVIIAKLRGVRKDGEEIPLKVALSSWKNGEAPIHCLSFKDLSEIHNAEKRAFAQERLAAVGQLAAGIAHDFNNILVPINLYSEILIRDHKLDQKGREMMETIRSQVGRATTLTGQILDFSRKRVMDFQTVDLRHELLRLTELLDRILPESIAIEFIHEGGRYILQADPTRLQQVFMNLALNARDAMPDGGTLSFDVSRLEVAPEGPPPYRDMPPGNWSCVKVSDTGTGIEERHLQRIFEPFFTTKEPGKGTGLGLAQVYGIIKQHGGYIDVHSVERAGTAIIMYFPLQFENSSTADTPPTSIYKTGDQETILIVEDDKEALRATCEALESLNYRTLGTSSGKRAMELYLSESIDLVLSDLVMPELSGIELYKALREIDAGVKVVMMTGYPLGTGTRELLHSGSVTWLQKPMDMERMAQVIQSALHP